MLALSDDDDDDTDDTDDDLNHVQANVPPNEVPSVWVGPEIKIYLATRYCGCRRLQIQIS